MGIHLKILAFTALILGFAALVPSDRACAGAIAQQTCDTEVWRTMATRARIETEREIMQNQNLIFKPDSILAYTCFDSMAAHAAAQAGVLFTHTNYWGDLIIDWGPPYGMDHAVNQTVLAAMRAYYEGNFAHEMLGGRGRELAMPLHEVTTEPSSTSTYACGMMGQVWAVAKCLNFLHTAAFAEDGFFPFIDLQPVEGTAVAGYQTIEDSRNYPTECAGAPFEGSTWLLQYRSSRNETAFGAIDLFYDFGTPLAETFDGVRERIEPGLCAAPPIPTGVSVILSPGSAAPYDDGVCSNPGCTFAGASCINSVPRPPGGGGGGGVPPPPTPGGGPS